MNDQQFEQLVQAKGLTAPRITADQVKEAIVGEYYFTAADGVLAQKFPEFTQIHHEELSLLTFCVLVLKNGFTVTGESACASPENFDAELGRIAARRNAENKIWPLMGYELKCRLAQEVK